MAKPGAEAKKSKVNRGSVQRAVTGPDAARVRYLAAGLAFASELIHLWAVPGWYAEWNTAGYLLLFVAGCQGALGVSLLFGAGKRPLRLGILFNLFVVFVWAFTRVVGIPAWLAFMPLPVEASGLLATAAEVALVVLLVVLLRTYKRKGQ